MIPAGGAEPEPEWLRIARSYKGIRETIGGKLNPQIVEFFKATHFPIAKLTPTTAWCAAFLCHCYMRAGVVPYPRSARAADLALFGVECEPRPGALIVLAPGVTGAGISGHAGLWELPLSEDSFWLFSGNCVNTARSHVYPTSRIVACRWPGELPSAA